MKISMYLSDTSKYWWTYLALRSNPALVTLLPHQSNKTIFFDITYLDQATNNPEFQKSDNHFFYVCWDGISDWSELKKVKNLIPTQAKLTVLVVGNWPETSTDQTQYQIISLYPEANVQFAKLTIHLDTRTSFLLTLARIKAFFMPIKNIAKFKNLGQSIRLLIGKPKFVFCGTYGTRSLIIQHLCIRHKVPFSIFDQYQFHQNDTVNDFSTYLENLRNDAKFLVNLYEQKKLNDHFFYSVIHLLGREYFVKKILSRKLASFINDPDTRVHINVYTTPFYAQHIFLDFGSVVGSGQYPRSMDLRYFKKRTIDVPMNNSCNIEKLVDFSRRGVLPSYFDELWDDQAFRL